MLVAFAKKDLDRLETDLDFDAGYPIAVVTAYRKRLVQIHAALDERDFYVSRSLHFEKLKGERSHQHSMRLNDQWRLILELSGKGPQKIVVIVNVENHYE